MSPRCLLITQISYTAIPQWNCAHFTIVKLPVTFYKLFCRHVDNTGWRQHIPVSQSTTIHPESRQKQSVWQLFFHWKLHDDKRKNSTLSGTLPRKLSMSVVSSMWKHKMSTVFKSHGRKQFLASWTRWLRLCYIRDANYIQNISGIITYNEGFRTHIIFLA